MIRARQTALLWAVAVLFAAACLGIAISADAWLTAAPRFGTQQRPLVIEGGRLLECLPPDGKSIAVLPDGVRLYANLELQFQAATAEKEATPLFIVARGRPLDGVWPMLTVRADRRLRGGLFVTSRDWGLYRIELQLPPGDHHFGISYINDRSRYPVNRDIDIAKVALGAPPPGWEGYIRWDREDLVPAGRFSIQAFALPEGEAVRLWRGGSLADDIFYPEGGLQKVSVLAEAAGAGQGRLALLVDGEEVERFEVTGGGFDSYRAQFEPPAGLHRLALVNRGDEILVRYLMADGAALAVPSTSGPLPLGEGLTIPAGMFEVEAAGELQQDGSCLLWSNGHIGRTISSATARRIRLTVVARGESCDGQGPRLLLMIGDDQLAAIDVDDIAFHPYTFDLDLAPGEQDIKVVYVNDRFVPGLCDRNLYILELRLEEAP